MGWALAAAWLAVASLIVLTLGTGAQAAANVAEFHSLQASVSKTASDALDEVLWKADPIPLGSGPYGHEQLSPFEYARFILSFLRMVLARKSSLMGIILMPHRLAQLRAKGGDDAVQMARFIRAAEVWAILMFGSALALAAAVIQLALAYQ